MDKPYTAVIDQSTAKGKVPEPSIEGAKLIGPYTLVGLQSLTFG